MLIDSEILSYVSQEYKSGVQITDIVSDLTERGYSQDEVLNILELSETNTDPYEPDYSSISTRNLHKGFVSLGISGVQMYVYDNFLDSKFCSEVSNALCPRIVNASQSPTTSEQTFEASNPTLFSELAEIDKNLGLLLEAYAKLPISCSEFMTLNVFNPLESTPFDIVLRPTKLKNPAFSRSNQPTWSFLVFLTDGLDGGELIFRDLDFSIAPKPGLALLWNRVDTDGRPVQGLNYVDVPTQFNPRYILQKTYRTFPIV